MKNLLRILPRVAWALFLAQLLLILVSWIYSAAFPYSGVRSLISGEGARWFMGYFSDMLLSPLLVWIILLSMAFGCLWRSNILQFFFHPRSGATYRERRALFITIFVLLLYILVLLLLTILPHAILLSSTGSLYPSPFFDSLIPVIAFGLTLLSAVYGMLTGSFRTLTDFYVSLLAGISGGAHFLLFYVLLMQIWQSLCYVLPGV